MWKAFPKAAVGELSFKDGFAIPGRDEDSAHDRLGKVKDVHSADLPRQAKVWFSLQNKLSPRILNQRWRERETERQRTTRRRGEIGSESDWRYWKSGMIKYIVSYAGGKKDLVEEKQTVFANSLYGFSLNQTTKVLTLFIDQKAKADNHTMA